MELIELALKKPAAGWQIAGPLALVIGVLMIVFRRPLGEFLPMARTDRVNHLPPLIPGVVFVLIAAYVIVAGLFGE
jgi:hypothetical protein